LHFHWQNLNERRDGSNGPAWRWGRAWWGPFHAEWRAFTKDFGFKVHHLGGAFTIFFQFGLYTLVVGFRELSFFSSNETGISWRGEDGTLCLDVLTRTGEWRSRDPWWRKGIHINVPDLLLGRAKFSTVPLETEEVLIPMPEGCYPATVKMEQSTWARPRWFAKRVVRADIDIPKAIPHEGKGENSWDCDEDATYGLCAPAANVEEAIGIVVGSVLRSRRRYGGRAIHRDLAPAMSPRA
jgi:hypothetical protein